jgi:hypothetical protein
LQVPLLVELVRRLINPSAFWLIVGDVFMTMTLVLAAHSIMAKYWRTQVVILMVLLFYATLSIIFNGLPPELLYVGTRPFIMGFVSLMLAHYIVERGRGVKHLIWMTLFWSSLITLYACTQLVLGIDHPINLLPVGIGDEDRGIGNYSELGTELFGIFRPTSIFFHTGKFGQVAFFMALVPALFLLSQSRVQPLLLRALTVLGFVAVLVSGQRASFLFLMIAFAVYSLHPGRIAILIRAAGVGLAILVFVGLFAGVELLTAIGDRYEGLVADGLFRLEVQSSMWLDVLIDSGILGQGVGLYGFGAASFVMDKAFVTEQSWIRLQAEWGILGFLIVSFFLLSVLLPCIMRSRYGQKDTSTDVLRFASVSIALSLAAWSFTHDVLGNTLTMQIAFSVLGATRGRYCGALAKRRFNAAVGGRA